MNSVDGIILYSFKDTHDLKLDLNEVNNSRDNISIELFNDAIFKIIKSHFVALHENLPFENFLEIPLIEIYANSDSSFNIN